MFLTDPVSFTHVTCLASVGPGVNVPPWVLPSPAVSSLPPDDDKNRTVARRQGRASWYFPPRCRRWFAQSQQLCRFFHLSNPKSLALQFNLICSFCQFSFWGGSLWKTKKGHFLWEIWFHSLPGRRLGLRIWDWGRPLGPESRARKTPGTDLGQLCCEILSPFSPFTLLFLFLLLILERKKRIFDL